MKAGMNMIVSALLIGASAALPASADRMELHDGWQFRQAGTSEWMPATVPGTVHIDLMKLGKIKDPFFGVNEKSLQWIGEKDWEYVKDFNVDDALLAASNVDLVMEGVDTYADVYVNDKKILSPDNMFRTWRVDVKPYLQKGKNNIRVAFRSVFREDMPKYLDAPFKLEAWPNNDQSDIPLSLYARKAGYNYGWDWGPRLITTGLWRPVYLESNDGLRIEGAQIATGRLKGNSAEMNALCEVVAYGDKEAKVSVSGAGANVVRTVTLHKGLNRIEIPFTVKNPRLWWTNGLGAQPLYDFDVTVIAADAKAAKKVTTGIRTVEVIRDKDADGHKMTVRLNGKDVFMKGADWIPLDNFPTRAGKREYAMLLDAAKEANMNMIRVWGGGIYENDDFYNLCDRNGLLVWQDIMFACGMFPADDHYLNSVAAEVRDNVRRLRNHPSVALWCGNNENEISWYEWGWKNRFSPEVQKVYESNLKKLFYDVVPGAIGEVDATRYYHPSSPVTGYNGIPYGEGDAHFWWVWKGGWIEEYLKPENIARFMSEYGFQSYPDMKTVKSFTNEWDRDISSEVMLAHQRAKNDQTRDPNFGNDMMKMYMSRYFMVPENLEDFIYMSQIMQAEAVKTAVEAHRRSKPYCMGTLYWQINDCWPVASWSSIDYYGRKKALHYTARDAYREMMVSPWQNGGETGFKVISDRQTPVKGTLTVKAMTLDGKEISSFSSPFTVPANGCIDAAMIPDADLYKGTAQDKAVVVASIAENGKELASNIWYPVYSNRYDYPEAKPEFDIAPVTGGVELTVSSPVLTRGLYLYTDDQKDNSEFDDNFFTLLPGEKKTVKVTTSLSPETFRNQLRYKAVNNIRK